MFPPPSAPAPLRLRRIAFAAACTLAAACASVRPSVATGNVAPEADTGDSAHAADAHGGPAATAGPPPSRFKSAEDSLDWTAARERALHTTGYRIIVSMLDRRLAVVKGADTLLSAPIAVAMRTSLDFAGREWTFDTPRGRRVVLKKTANPVWTPPDWHYAEVAHENGLKLARLSDAQPHRLQDGSRLVVREGRVGIVRDGKGFSPLPEDEEIIFDSTVFIPPYGTKNRRIPGELGRFALDLGEGYLLHGTPHKASIGTASTHGCIRLRDEDIAWLYEFVPVKTPVWIY